MARIPYPDLSRRSTLVRDVSETFEIEIEQIRRSVTQA
jgi:hypothetical protein